ncbi:molybdopterin-dependent oxidoreductase [Rhodoplanes sp. TEM]|uniref:Molybdopterin-dependent oxidoreductase n=1 Tax=Rhodoplanes tepidamans TaxID=200616 RepID=A0ABT5J947_RHOTP|nr:MULTISPECIES: molybdopterin cofactor-binding domain-containing protein [Rhodoplanes]MDC7785992.1 molybdopterin-dependent oxidoreductase [Rhodoplanes tepidamans]MDC7984912.1 molybdopterin-dependent oxidoreductase [Rhodoplanes sp. TEM]MDQ0357041.1 CO/xanthine dehydrogenase Mo-binding subunit [Rhodoplanes tepidamans]
MIPNTLPQSLIDNPLLSDWIGFEPEGRVRVSTGKVEIGQGILTALVQIAAEELDVAPSRIRTVSGETSGGPNEGVTAGSTSVAMSGAAIRLACAEVRALFLAHGADRLGVPAESLVVEDGRLRRDGRDTGHDYWSLAAEIDLTRPATGGAPAKSPTQYRVVGTDLPRVDLPAKIEGRGFIHDMVAPDLVHARIVHRPWRDARLASLDEAAVRRAAGLPIEILREGDFAALLGEREFAVQRAALIAREKAVWEGGTPLPDDTNSPDWVLAQPSRTRVVDTGTPPEREDGEVVSATYWRPFQTYGSIGPSCALARFEDGQLTVWSHTQNPYALREQLARCLGLDGAVTVLHRQAAGCYGHNTADDAAFDAAFLATRRPGRTVRVLFTREDEFMAAPFGAAMVIGLRAVLGPDRRPASWTIDIASPVHSNRPGSHGHHGFRSREALPDPPPQPVIRNDNPDAAGGGATRNGYALYDLPFHRLIHRTVDPVPLRTSSLRGLGAYANIFAIESFMDELAEAAGADAVAYRLSLMSDPRARAVIEAAAEMCGWPGDAPRGEGRGLGLGFGRYKNRAAYMAVAAEVEVDEAVRLVRIWGAADCGLVITPDGAKNQLEGGIIQAASWALKEELRFADGKVATTNWDDYPILRFSEMPEIEIRLVGESRDPPLGVGEAAMGPTAAAIGNAVARALGTRIRALPLSRERIMAALLA